MFGFMRKFCPALFTTRTRSTVGLKSMPNTVEAPVPTRTGVMPSAATNDPVVPIGVATAVVEEMV